MPETRENTEEFDTVVVGGGLAGLTAAALLSKEGHKVVLLEKNMRVGGYAASYTVKGHRFDIAIQAIGGCEQGGIIPGILEKLGCKESVNFIPCNPARVYYNELSDVPWVQEGSWRRVAKDLKSRFPEYRFEIEKCYETWSGILNELNRISSGTAGPAEAFTFPRSYPLLSRYGDYTLSKFFNELSLPQELQSLLAARSGYCMLAPDRLSLVGFACTEMTYGHGAWMVEGGIESLAKSLSHSFRSAGGEIQLRSEVDSILTNKGEINGVRTRAGQIYLSRNVILASAARPALESWLDRPELLSERYRAKLRKMEATGSYYIGYYRVDADAVQGLFPNVEVRGYPEALTNGWSPDTYYMLIPSLVDMSAAPEGSHCLCLSLPCPVGIEPVKRERKIIRGFLEKSIEARFPSLKGKLDFLFDLCPENLKAISGNPEGSAYGWALLPEQSGIKRLNIKTPVAGLYLAGHWTMPGGGIAGVITSGILSANALLNWKQA
ncbi:phytoene desaturase family protein [Thermodesulfobacteriota bacterium]